VSTTPQLRDVVASLFVEPLHGFNRAQHQALETWIQLLRSMAGLSEGSSAVSAEAIPGLLALAPRWSAAVKGDLALTLRLTSLRRQDTGVSIGIGAGPFQAAGTFGLMSEQTSESIIQARASYTVTNSAGEVSLEDVLASVGFPIDSLTSAEKLKQASKQLETVKATLPAPTTD